ncbi:MAG: ribonuclease HII [Tenericutes bacterium 4572_104]|nr:MAG: ribonuclease HII [Tenericutes bacterium 4572_104]
MYKFENGLWEKGYINIVGVDEVGRGPLAGPVVACAVILDPSKPILGLKDSKQLSSKQRKQFLIEIKEKALDYAISFVSERVIEEINIYQASKKAMLNAINALSLKPDYILSDAMPLPESNIEYLSIIKGDTLSASIAAASILAKEARDAFMIKQSIKFPEYDFEHNMGYPTKKHLAAIKRFGIRDIHRKTYKPIKDIIDKQIFEEEQNV